jgi:hypothetical protein
MQPYELSCDRPAFDPAQGVFLYRGYRIELRLSGVCGTYRHRRPDGSWRYTLPTQVGGYRVEWVVLAPADLRDAADLDVADSLEEAAARVDARLSHGDAIRRP